MKIRHLFVTTCAFGLLYAQAAMAVPSTVVEDVFAPEGAANTVVNVVIDGGGVAYFSVTVDILYDPTRLTPQIPDACDNPGLGDPYQCTIFSPGTFRMVKSIGLPTEFDVDVTFLLSGTAGPALPGVYPLAVDDSSKGCLSTGYITAAQQCVPSVGSADGSITVQGASYNSSNPTPEGQINFSGFSNAPVDDPHVMTVLNDGPSGTMLSGECIIEDLPPRGSAAAFSIANGVFTDVTPAAGHDVTVTCLVATETLGNGTYNANLNCRHDGDDSGTPSESIVTYPLECVVSDQPIQNLVLTKSSVQNSYTTAGDPIDYTFTVLSNGGLAVPGPITISDPQTTGEVCDLSVVGNGDNNLDDGEQVVCTAATYVVTQTDVDNGFINNCATASGDGGGTQSNEDCHGVSGPNPAPGIDIQKTGTANDGGDGIVHPGDTIDYDFVVENIGNVTLFDVEVTDPLIGLGPITCPPGNPIPSMAPGDIVTCTASYTVDAGDILAQGVSNLALVSGDCPDQPPPAAPVRGGEPNCATDEDGVRTPIVPDAEVEIVKTADPIEYRELDELITYTFEVTNLGNVPLISIDVTDPLINGQNDDIECNDTDGIGDPTDHIIDRLEVFESTTCTGTYNITQSDLDSDTVDNTANALADCEIDGPDRGDGLGEECAEDDGSASIERIADIATFTVFKDFTDDNTAGVQIYIECTTGLPIESDAVIYEFHAIFDRIDFIVQDYDEEQLDCIIFEDVPDGYSVDYEASLGEDGEAGSIADSDDGVDGCRFLSVVGGQFICEITNSLDQVRVTVDKVWVDDLAAENGAFLFAGAWWECSPVADINDVSGEPYEGQLTFHGTAANPWDYDYFWFWPHFEGSDCSVTEAEFDSDIISDDSDCQDLEIFPGHDLGLRGNTNIPVADCTIVNTRIYAGIPTLSEYGLALLALLMLGIGFVGFRRFA